jgi:hypothetical protein
MSHPHFGRDGQATCFSLSTRTLSVVELSKLPAPNGNRAILIC